MLFIVSSWWCCHAVAFVEEVGKVGFGRLGKRTRSSLMKIRRIASVDLNEVLDICVVVPKTWADFQTAAITLFLPTEAGS